MTNTMTAFETLRNPNLKQTSLARVFSGSQLSELLKACGRGSKHKLRENAKRKNIWLEILSEKHQEKSSKVWITALKYSSGFNKYNFKKIFLTIYLNLLF